MGEVNAMKVVRKATVRYLKRCQWAGWEGHPETCLRCQAIKSEGHTDECELQAELVRLKGEEEYQRLQAVADAAHALCLNANARRVVHSNVDYIPAYLLAPLREVLDDHDALDEEEP